VDLVFPRGVAVVSEVLSAPATPAAFPRPRSPSIARLAAPLSAFYLIQSAVSLLVLSILGHAGTAVLAGVGAAGGIYMILLALLFGLDTAVQARVARAIGARDEPGWGSILADATLIAAPLGTVIAAVLCFGGPVALHLMISDATAARAGADWARAAAPSLLCLAFTIPTNALWVGSARPARALLVTALTAPVQVGATLWLVLGGSRHSGAAGAGAGAATSIAALVGAVIQAALLSRAGAAPGLMSRAPDPQEASHLVRLGWPISVQQSLHQVGLMIVYPLVAQLGAPSLAIVNVLITLGTAPAQISIAMGAAAGALAGQALGAADAVRSRWLGWRAVSLALVCVAPFAVAAGLYPKALMRLFIHDPDTVFLAEPATRWLGLAILAQAAAQVLSFAMRGVGATRLVAAVGFAALWIAQLPAAVVGVILLGWDLTALLALQAGVALVEGLVLAAIWWSGIWLGAARRAAHASD
jgi:putative MATE family efflux protein